MVVQERMNTRVLLCEHDEIHLGGEHKMDPNLTYWSSHCQPLKTIKPAVEKLHENDGSCLIWCFANSCNLTMPNTCTKTLCSRVNTYFLGVGMGDRCSWLLPKYPTLWTEFEIKNFIFLSLQPSQ